MAERPLSVWDAAGARGESSVTKVATNIPLGHLASDSFAAPEGVEQLGITDLQESGFFTRRSTEDLDHFLRLFFPHPVRYRKAWALSNLLAVGGGSNGKP